MSFIIEKILSTGADVPGVGLFWLNECPIGIFSLTDRDKALKPGLPRLKRDVWLVCLLRTAVGFSAKGLSALVNIVPSLSKVSDKKFS